MATHFAPSNLLRPFRFHLVHHRLHYFSGIIQLGSRLKYQLQLTLLLKKYNTLHVVDV